jgi:hypothetical protein
MKKVSLSLVIVLLIALALMPPVHATPPSPAAGELVLVTLESGYLTGTFAGTFDTLEAHGRVERLRFDGCVGTACGTVIFHIVDLGPNGLGYWTLHEGTDELTNLHGQGKWYIDLATLTGRYEGTIHFDS